VPLVDASKMSREMVDVRLWTFDSGRGSGKNPRPLSAAAEMGHPENQIPRSRPSVTLTQFAENRIEQAQAREYLVDGIHLGLWIDRPDCSGSIVSYKSTIYAK
jgi:hypothetical protein